jgi:hypothetical protein
VRVFFSALIAGLACSCAALTGAADLSTTGAVGDGGNGNDVGVLIDGAVPADGTLDPADAEAGPADAAESFDTGPSDATTDTTVPPVSFCATAPANAVLCDDFETPVPGKFAKTLTPFGSAVFDTADYVSKTHSFLGSIQASSDSTRDSAGRVVSASRSASALTLSLKLKIVERPSGNEEAELLSFIFETTSGPQYLIGLMASSSSSGITIGLTEYFFSNDTTANKAVIAIAQNVWTTINIRFDLAASSASFNQVPATMSPPSSVRSATPSMTLNVGPYNAGRGQVWSVRYDDVLLTP